MRFSLIYCVLLCFQTARAEFKNSSCPNIKKQDFAQVFLEDGVLCKTVEEIQRVLGNINAFAGVILPQTLFVQQKSYQSFGTYGQIIVLNQQQQAWGGTRPQIQNEKIWAHEIGHIFFSNWLARDFEPIQGFREYMISSGEIQIKKRDPNFETSQELKLKWKSDFGKARDIQAPYSEFFADFVGVLYSNDIMAMAQAMEADGMSDSERAKIKYYAFTGKYNISKWTETDVHYFFAPARAYVGEHLLKFPMTNIQKSSLTQKIYRACAIEIQKYWNASRALPSPEKANESLIQTLSKLE